MKATPLSHMTECGIPGIGPVPYGVHLCHFYSQRQELVESLVPFFSAGLRNGERCLWVTEEPLPAAQARAELLKQAPGMERMLDSGQLQIFTASDWYGGAGTYVAADLAGLWAEAEKDALAAGCKGLRVSGNTSFLHATDWDDFMTYEAAVSPTVEKRRVLALCSYSLPHCRPTDLVDVVRNHHFTLDRDDASGWSVRQDSIRARFAPDKLTSIA